MEQFEINTRCPGSSFSATSRSWRQFLNCLAAIQGIMWLYCTRIPQDFHRRPRFIRFPSPLYASPKPNFVPHVQCQWGFARHFLPPHCSPPLNNVNPGLSLLGGYPPQLINHVFQGKNCWYSRVKWARSWLLSRGTAASCAMRVIVATN